MGAVRTSFPPTQRLILPFELINTQLKMEKDYLLWRASHSDSFLVVKEYFPSI